MLNDTNLNNVTNQVHSNWYIKIRIMLAVYAFSVLIGIQILSNVKNGGEILLKERYLIFGVCAFFIEVINQITYQINKYNNKRAVIVKAISFWVVFTVGVLIYAFKLFNLDYAPNYNIMQELALTFVYLILSVMLAHYSMTPKFRFLFLRGKFSLASNS